MSFIYFIFLIGWFLIIGVPFFSGFFSENKIFFHAFFNSIFFGSLFLVTLGVTVFYMTKLMIKVFGGESRVEKNVYSHKVRFLFISPLVILAICLVLTGFLGLPNMFLKYPVHLLGEWLNPMIKTIHYTNKNLILEGLLMCVFILTITVCSIFAYFLYVKKEDRVIRGFSYVKHPFFIRFFRNLVDIKDFYKKNVINLFKEVTQALWLFIDINLINRFFVSISKSIISIGEISRIIKSKNLQIDVTLFVLTVVIFLMEALFIRE